MATTIIAWTDHSWNAGTGCTKVSRGCDNCYAFTLHNRRYAENVKAALRLGIGTAPKGTTIAQRARSGGHRLTWPRQYDVPFTRIQAFPDRLRKPYTIKKPARIFVNSMSDLFHEGFDDTFVADVFRVMNDCPQHTFQILTKRPERAAGWPGPWTPNIWMGTSVEDQAAADLRIPHLLRCGAAVRFLSCEPLLAPVRLAPWIAGLRWVIVGGESGPGFRPMPHEWARAIRDQCADAGVAFFFKQSAAPRTEMGTALEEPGGSRWQWRQFPDQLTPPVKIAP